MTVTTTQRQTVTPVKPRSRRITGEELLAMGDIGPCELVNGRIVPMVPTGAEHGAIESNLNWHLCNFVIGRRLGRVMNGEVGVLTRRRPDSVRGADIAFVSNERLGSRLMRGFLDIAPELVVEIMSPDDRWRDIREKLTEYFAIGVERVWLVDPSQRTVLVYRSPTELIQLAETDTLTGEGVLEGFSLSVAELFAE